MKVNSVYSSLLVLMGLTCLQLAPYSSAAALSRINRPVASRKMLNYNVQDTISEKEEASGQEDLEEISEPCPHMTLTDLFDDKLHPVLTCHEFWPSPSPAISLPKDTDTIKFGAIFNGGYCHLLTRAEQVLPFNCSLLPDVLLHNARHANRDTMLQSVSQMLFKAELDENLTIVSVELIIFIDRTAMTKSFLGTSFIGTLTNSAPLPPGIESHQWFRWDLDTTFMPYRLFVDDPNSTLMVIEGNFTNLYEWAYDPLNDTCQPPLIDDEETQQWYEHAVGNGTDLKFYWYPDMHGPLDSEFVPIFSNHVSYMSSLPNPSYLLASNVDVDKEYRFIIHGTPVGVLMYFQGHFVKRVPHNSRLEALCNNIRS
jgi:hypothetical protein